MATALSRRCRQRSSRTFSACFPPSPKYLLWQEFVRDFDMFGLRTFPSYRHVSPRSIDCEPFARRFRADQRPCHTPVEISTLSLVDVVCMVRNAFVVEKAISLFERQIVRRVKLGSNNSPLTYLQYKCATGHNRRPPYLTHTERPRFIRIHYQLWGMMKLDPGEWQARLEKMRLKDLYFLFEMSVAPPTSPNAEPDSGRDINWSKSQKRRDLKRKTWAHIEDIYQQVQEEKPEQLDVYALEDGWPPFVAIWDHWQYNLKEWVCHPTGKARKELLWDDSEDDEQCGFSRVSGLYWYKHRSGFY
ncbi:uncharacterized protein PAC_16485 [Phialocephala subalpina]|uniref:Uncharacterized protein n=1 Tax=Phialocephala subalpina TaxID=576137 RepID=A0A1L7XNJ5_9HELO|nr:uncharacterized protein PAC_16485 [Phialocephala subalpina]